MYFTHSATCLSRSSGAGVEAENQSRDADKSGGGDQPEEAGIAATVRTCPFEHLNSDDLKSIYFLCK